MPKVLRTPSGRGIYLIPRSGSHSIAAAVMQSFHPEIAIDASAHPAASYPDAGGDGPLCVIVRNPVERFRSMVAHAQSTVEEQLAAPRYGCEFCFGQTYDAYFRFEDQLQACADWLGITVPLPHLDGTDEADKPTLTPEQDAAVRLIYAADIALWESLQN